MNNNSNNNETTSSTPESQFMSERKLKRLFLTMDKEDMGYIELVRLQYLKSKVYNKPKVSTIAQPTTATSSSSSSDTSSEDLDSIDRKATNQDTNRDAVAGMFPLTTSTSTYI